MKLSLLFLLLALITGCVPKTHYDDQHEKLREAQERLAQIDEAEKCDRDTLIQLREQAQSLDLLSQELVERNTELSKEVARLRTLETSTKSREMLFQKQIEEERADAEGRVERVRATYEDLIRELKMENKRLKSQLDEAEVNLQKALSANSAPAKKSTPAKTKSK